MCGLFGCIGSRKNDEILWQTYRAAKERGPDGAAFFDGSDIREIGDWNNVDVVIGHCRLATSAAVELKQPIVAGKAAITHNGNVPDYQAKSKSLGIDLETGCDSELILRSYLKTGSLSETIRILELRMWAIVIWNGTWIESSSQGLPLFFRRHDDCLHWCSKRIGEDWMASDEFERNANQPISSVEWVDRESIRPNDYNPNKQASPEHRLLKVSILEDGWTQPIVVFDDGSGEKPVIVDGEHRWRVSADKDIRKMTSGLVPVVRIAKSREDRIMSTIRHNRARGEHSVVSMADLVKELLESGKSPDEICTLLGMEDEEVERLAEKAGMPVVAAKNHAQFSKGWIPG